MTACGKVFEYDIDLVVTGDRWIHVMSYDLQLGSLLIYSIFENSMRHKMRYAILRFPT